jgi:hypothetical protein
MNRGGGRRNESGLNLLPAATGVFTSSSAQLAMHPAFVQITCSMPAARRKQQELPAFRGTG